MTHRFGWGGEVQGGTAGQSSDIWITNTSKNQRNIFTYDAAGNLTFDLGQNFAYDVTGQQTSASYSGYSLNQYYDGDGLRVKKTENGTTTTWYLRSTVLGGTSRCGNQRQWHLDQRLCLSGQQCTRRTAKQRRLLDARRSSDEEQTQRILRARLSARSNSIPGAQTRTDRATLPSNRTSTQHTNATATRAMKRCSVVSIAGIRASISLILTRAVTTLATRRVSIGTLTRKTIP